ncbi:MAG: hypothetical protein U0R81_07480 [Mycobacterium sp.]
MHAAVRPYLTTGVAIVGASVLAVSPLIVVPDSMNLPDLAAVEQTVSHPTQLVAFAMPGAQALFSAFGDVLGGMTGAGDTFLSGLADQIVGGTNLLNSGLSGGAGLLAAGLIGGVQLATSGTATGADAFAQIIQGLADATGEFSPGADTAALSASSTSVLPGPGDLLSALADVFGGLTGAGGTFLGGLSDQIVGGTALLNGALGGGAQLLAAGILGGISLVTSGTSMGAGSFAQIVESLADAVGVFGPGGGMAAAALAANSASLSGVFPGPGDVLAAASDVFGGLTGAGTTFLGGLGDQITGGTALLNGELAGGAALLASGLVNGVGLVRSGTATGAHSLVQVIDGVADAVGEFAPGGSSAATLASSRSSALPGPGDVLAAAADVSGGLAGAGNTFLNGVGDQITGGTRLLNKELKGGAALAASGIVGGTGLLTSGTANGAHAAGQVVGGLADAVNEFAPNNTGSSSAAKSSVAAPAADSTSKKTAAGPSAGDGSGANASKSDGGSNSGGSSARRSHRSSDNGGSSGSARSPRHSQK